ncbi:MAG: hypothetical protein K6E49_10805 [Lachnospiraceae bacterium]|nr:hypothetical protein [Lachnospiraceae bacterium]
MFKLTVPVLLITFNRPDSAKAVFDRVRRQRPTKLYLASDGPRDSVPGEREVVYSLREDLEKAVDWDCEVIKIYSDKNLSCAKRVATAIDEVFAHENEAIILEDDCVANDSFFEFCQEMLVRYRNDERVLSISGSKVIDYDPGPDKDYFFSKVFWCWGWATWKRAWEIFDYDLKDYEQRKNDPVFDEVIFEKDANWILKENFDKLLQTEPRYAWDYIFYFYSILNGGYHIFPKYNLVTNIGFGGDCTNTTKKPKWYVEETREMTFPIRLQDDIEWEREYDRQSFIKTKQQGIIVHIKRFLGMDTDVSVFSKEFWQRRKGK